MAELTQLNITLADYHTIVADLHHAIAGIEAALHGFSVSAAESVADRDKTVRDTVAESVKSATSGMHEQLTRARSVLTALQQGQITGDSGRVIPHHVPGQPVPAGATVTVAQDDPDGDVADAPISGGSRTEFRESDDRTATEAENDRQAALRRGDAPNERAEGEKSQSATAKPAQKP